MKTTFVLIGVLIAERISGGSTVEVLLEIGVILLALFLDLLNEVRRNERINEMTAAEKELQGLYDLMNEKTVQVDPLEVAKEKTEEDEK